VTNDQRNAAEAVFMSFRKTNMPYSICRYILGNIVFIIVCYVNVSMSFSIARLLLSLNINEINIFHINKVIGTNITIL